MFIKRYVFNCPAISFLPHNHHQLSRNGDDCEEEGMSNTYLNGLLEGEENVVEVVKG